MNKKGDAQRLMLEIAYISFAALIGLAVLYSVFTYTKDTSFQAKAYAKDIANTLELMQSVNSDNVKVTYDIKDFQFRLDNQRVYVKDKDSEQSEKYNKKSNIVFTYKIENNKLILEKNEQ